MSMSLALPHCAVILCLAVLPTAVFAHAGVLKTTDTIDIFYKQSPLSPLVGEEVRMTFVFTEHDKNDQIRSMPVTLSVIDTFAGDESRDAVIYTDKLMTDHNGAITFSWTFRKENHFDIELAFGDLNGKQQATGFLIQPRERTHDPSSFLFGAACAASLGLLFWRKQAAGVRVPPPA